MNDLLRLVICLVAYATLFSLSAGMLAGPASAGDYIANFERIPAIENAPPQVATWKTTPTVIVCEHAPVSRTEIDRAVRFWKSLGHNFMSTQYKYDPRGKCGDTNPIGYIVVHLITSGIRLEEKNLAQTHFYVDNNTNKVEWAIIYLRPTLRETVLEHEIGHALGFLHFNKINHLMNKKWTQGGWDKNGLGNRRR